MHCVEISYAVLVVLNWVFPVDMLVGAAGPVGIKINNHHYTVSWGMNHVSLAEFAVAQDLFHAYVAVYYK